MLAAIAPAALRRVNGLRRVAPLPEWGVSGTERLDRAPLLVLWDSLVPQSRARAGPSWSRFLSSGSGRDGHGDGSGKNGKEAAEGAPLEEGALKEEAPENEALRESGKTEASGEKLKESEDDPKKGNEEKEGNGAAESNNRSQHGAIVPALGPRPDRVIAVPLTRRPLFPGFYVPVSIKDQKLADKLAELKSAGTPWVGSFLLKDQKPRTDGSPVLSAAEGGEGTEDLRGEELFNRLHEYGTFAQITNVMRPLDGEGATQVLLMGHRRLRITGMLDTEPLSVGVEHLRDKPYDSTQDELKATILEVVTTMKDLMRLNPLYKEHIQMFVQHMGEFNASKLADFGAALTTADEPLLQEVLEELDVLRRLHLTLVLLKKELELSKLQQSIAKGVEEKMTGDQRKYFLMEQLKAIKKELGLETDDKTALTDSAKFRERLEPRRKECPANVLQVIEEEMNKLQGLESSSSEFNVTRNYLDWLTSLPWGHFSEENFDVNRAQKVLDDEHYGLEDVKERILEFIAVGRLRGKAQGKIICLAGPPGVGKTSIGRSIAHALNRQFYRFSVGGLGDVAEIKGHRRTYVGAMPGKMVQCLKAVGTSNPLVLIDEIDKLGRGHSGDPASALLELLDPEQNANFLDHYLDVPIDLSKVLFVCTANLVENIPGPLLDRMEVIRLVGYITDEKTHIARGYLEKAARDGSGVKAEQVDLSDAALHALIETYCREAGVRNLQKHIERIYRKVALKLVRKELESLGTGKETPLIIEEVPVLSGTATDMEKEEGAHKTSSEVVIVEEPVDGKEGGPLEPVEKLIINETNLPDYVGPPIFQSDRLYEHTPVGVVMGLAWTAMGGSTLYVETSLVEQGDGKGSLQMTGQLGDVMKESATIAHTFARKILREREPENNFFATSRMHLHVPAGATPKDGPSAGCTMITSMLSLAMNAPVNKDVAMTGEVTLTGRVLPIGGVKEKTVAARRSGVKTVIFPAANKRDFLELPAHVKEGLEVHFVDHYSEIFTLAFDFKPDTEKQLAPVESGSASHDGVSVVLHT